MRARFRRVRRRDGLIQRLFAASLTSDQSTIFVGRKVWRHVGHAQSDRQSLVGRNSIIRPKFFDHVIGFAGHVDRRQADKLFQQWQHLFAMSLGISDALERGGQNFFDLVRSFSYALVMGDQSEKRKLQDVLQIGDRSKTVLLHEQIVGHAQHRRVDGAGFESESAVRHFSQS